MARFDLNDAAVKALAADPAVRAAMERATLAVGAQIKAAAEPFRNTGFYLRTIRVLGTRVRFGDPFAHLSEFGSVNNPPQRNALRGIRAAGLRYEDTGRNQAE